MPTPSVTPGGFYSLFYRWATSACKHHGHIVPTRLPSRPLKHARNGPRSYTTSDSPIPSKGRGSHISEHMRSVMRKMPHSVVVITAPGPSWNAKKEGERERDDTRSMTVSSFNTVALQPEVIVSFNVKLPSSTMNAIRQANGYFVANMLVADVASARLADSFAGGSEKVETSWEDVRFSEDLFRPESEKGDEHGVLPGYQGLACISAAKCRLLADKEIRVGDHLVLVAKVEELAVQMDLAGDPLGLVYADRAYHAIGSKISLEKDG